MRRALLLLVLLAGCADSTSLPLVSAQTPPNTSRNSEPQAATSLPPGAANPSTAPGASEPNFLSITLGRRG